MRLLPHDLQLGIVPLAAATTTAGPERFEIRPESPLFTGHFPGEPLFPGIAHLALASRVLGPGVAIIGIESLRLRQPVFPGDVVEIDVETSPEGNTARFEVRKRGGAVASGRGLSLAATRDPGLVQTPTEEPLSAAGGTSRLPHRPPALLVHDAMAVGSAQATAICAIPLDHPLGLEGRCPGFMVVEAAAQAAGLLAQQPVDSGEPQHPGVLVAVRDARFPAWIPVGVPFRVQTWREAEVPPLSVFRFSIEGNGGAIATGELSTYAVQSRPKQNH
jgi:3-hydroxyacyl-[acyl-carrier-protein] dehydratase